MSEDPKSGRPGLPRGFDWRCITAEDSPMTPADMIADPRHRDLATAELSVGDPAFDFELPVFDFSEGTERATGETFHLRAVARERPVALVFGSYT